MDYLEKEYCKLSLDQFKWLVKELPEIRSQMQELPELVRTASKEKINEILTKDFYWAVVYEFPFREQIALLFGALGHTQKLIEFSKSPDPTQAALGWCQNEDTGEWNGGEGGVFEKKHIILALPSRCTATFYASCSFTVRWTNWSRKSAPEMTSHCFTLCA